MQASCVSEAPLRQLFELSTVFCGSFRDRQFHVEDNDFRSCVNQAEPSLLVGWQAIVDNVHDPSLKPGGDLEAVWRRPEGRTTEKRANAHRTLAQLTFFSARLASGPGLGEVALLTEQENQMSRLREMWRSAQWGHEKSLDYSSPWLLSTRSAGRTISKLSR